ncbi:MAG: CotH kinase family protein [Fibrobacter sp.]|nr:CotH kinase family protein [Fibrobacter sp.]
MCNLLKSQFGILCAIGFALVVVSGCSSDDSSTSADEQNASVLDDAANNDGNPGDVGDEPPVIGGSPDDSNGDTFIVTHPDVDEKGDTIIVIDTIHRPVDTSLHWVGNSALVITEINALNLDWLDENGDDPSWVEIYNAGDAVANLKGYALLENKKTSSKWIFGDEYVQPKSFRIVFCDKKNITTLPEGSSDKDGLHPRTHTNWKMDKDGGTIYLIDPYYGIRDSVDYPELKPGMSWGIVDGGAWRFFDKPTPEAPNNQSTAYDELLEPADMGSIKSGFYSEPFTINPPSLDAGVKIRCTTNGSEPTKDSQEFNSPISIDHSMAFRCATFKDGALTKDIVTRTFIVGEEDVNMPIVAISVDSSFFREHYIKTNCDAPSGCSDSAGLYAEVEMPIHVEYFENGSKTKGSTWEMEAGITLMGGYSRLNDKKSVSIRIREEYEDGSINYPLFETRKGVNDKYRSFNLRNNGNRFVSDYIEDAMGGAILEGSGLDYQRSRQVVVFYNGHYYGIHDMRERFNKHYIETNYQIESNTVTVVKHLEKDVTESDGNIQGYMDMLHFVATNDFSGENNAKYEEAKTLLDVGNLADYMAAEIYMHNGDWPNNNVRAWRSIDQPWKFMVYDLDHGFDWMWGVNGGEFDQHTEMFPWIKKGGGNKPCKVEGCFPNLYIQLIENPDFKRMFINRSAVMFHDYTNAAKVEKTVDAMVATIPESEMERDLAKFKQNEKYYTNSCGDGFSRTGSCLKSWAQERDSKVISEYKEEFGVSDLISVKIKANGNGVVLMEGMTLPGNAPTNYSGKFFGGVQMQLMAVPTDGAVFTGWDDGDKENPRIVSPTDGVTYTANFN